MNLTGYYYYFAAGAFTTPGEHPTVRPAGTVGVLNTGTLLVEVTDDLAVTNAAAFDFCGPSGSLCPIWGISPGSIASVVGSDSIAPTTAVAPGANLPTVLAGVSVTIRDSKQVSRTAPLYFVSPRQINFLVPAETEPGQATLTVVTTTGPRSISTLVTATRPGIFTANANGQGVAAAQVLRIRPDGSQVFEDVFTWVAQDQQWTTRYVTIGQDTVYLILYGTGIRNNTDVRASCWCTRTVGTLDLPVTYAGPQWQYPGLDQVNILLPHSIEAQDVNFYATVWLTVGGQDSNPVRLVFQ
jgi:uncharacterized protein (TIGR03437 family)